MNYKVTFYKNELEMLTERKANFVNNIKLLTTKAFEELAQRTDKKGKTSAISILEQLEDSITSNNGIWEVNLMVYNILFKFKFITDRSQTNYFTKYNGSGYTSTSNKNGRLVVDYVSVQMKMTINDDFDPKKEAGQFTNELKRVLTHELAHAKDDFLKNEIHLYRNNEGTSGEPLGFYTYWITPTEIRSHMLQMIQTLSSKRHNNPNRTFKNMYKTSDKARQYGVQHTEERKNDDRKVYSIFKKKHDATKIDQRATDALMGVISKAFRGNCPKFIRRFLFDYHLSYIKYSHPKMKERYYDKFFPNTPAHKLGEMVKFFMAMKEVQQQFMQIKQQLIEVSSILDGDIGYEMKQSIKQFNDLYTNLWNNSELQTPFKNYDSDLLEKIGHQMAETFRDKWDL